MTAGSKIEWKPYRPSNGTEGEMFISGWCFRCERDRAYQEDPNNADGCPILASTMVYDVNEPEFPKEWRIPANVNVWPKGAECTAFEEARKPGDAGPSVAVRDTLTKELF